MESMIELINGDAIDVIDEVLKKTKKPVIVTDPPFNIGYKYRTYKDKMPEKEYFEMLAKIFGGGHPVGDHTLSRAYV